MTDDLTGLDLERFGQWYQQRRPDEINGELRGRLLAGGKSNLTYEVTDGARWWIVRRPPLGHVLATAHDMSREYRVMTALHGTAVPVPQTYALCEETEVIGAPFYVMQRVVGTPFRRAAQLEPLGPQRTGAITTRMVQTLAALHAVDPVAVGLVDFGRPEGFLARQVRRWGKQLDGSRSRELPGADELFALLQQRLPDEQQPAIVHGDYRLDNLLVDEHDQVAAVLDWEMATIGDPLTDVAVLVAYRRMTTLGAGLLTAGVSDAALAPGFLTDVELVECYTRSGGRAAADLGFYLGLAYFKLAVILEGIHYRYLQGQTVGQGFDTVGSAVEPLLTAGLDAMKERS